MIFNAPFLLLSLMSLSNVTCAMAGTSTTGTDEGRQSSSLTRYSMILESLKSERVPDKFSPITRSMINALAKGNLYTADFFDFLFNSSNNLVEIDPGNVESIESHLLASLARYKTERYHNFVEIVDKVVIPEYTLLKNLKYYNIAGAINIDGSNIASVLERKAIEHFKIGYESIAINTNDGVYLQQYLMNARKNVGFKSGHDKYHFAFLIQVPYDILRKLTPEGDTFDECFAKLSQDAYNLMIKMKDEAELILSSILPVVYDNMTDVMSYSDKIEMFVQSEVQQQGRRRNYKFNLIEPDLVNINGHKFLYDFLQKYLPEMDLTYPVEYDALVLYVVIKRIERIYPSFVKDHYSEILKKCIDYIKENQPSLNFGLIALNNGFIEILDFDCFRDLKFEDVVPVNSKIYCFRRFLKNGGIELMNYDSISRFIEYFYEKHQYEMVDFICFQVVLHKSLDEYLNFLLMKNVYYNKNKRFELAKYILDSYKPFNGKYIIIEAFNHLHEDVIKFFAQFYPETLEDTKILSFIITKAALNYNNLVIDLVSKYCKPEFFEKALANVQLRSRKEFLDSYRSSSIQEEKS